MDRNQLQLEQKKGSTSWGINFFPVWAGQAVSLVGSRVVQFALIWYLTQQTGSATVLALATLVGIVPEIILGPIAGIFVDRWDRQIVLIAADGLVALAAWWLAYLFWSGSVQVGHIYIILFVRALAGSFHWPAMQASTSLMVPETHLARINGLNQAVNGGLTILGPLLGALLLGLMPLYGIMMVDVGTAILAILPLIFIRIPLPARTERSPGQESVWRDLRQGLEYILNWRGLTIIIGMAMVTRLLLMPAFSLLPLLVSEHFGGTAAQLGFLESVLGVGMLLGGLILSLWGGFRRRIYTTLGGIVFLGFGLVVLGFVPGDLFALALICTFFIGLAVPFIDGPLMAILQATVAPEFQGRVFTLMGSLISLATPIGLILAGPLSDIVNIQFWYVLAGLAYVLIGATLFFVPDVIRMEDRGKESGAEPGPVVQ